MQKNQLSIKLNDVNVSNSRIFYGVQLKNKSVPQSRLTKYPTKHMKQFIWERSRPDLLQNNLRKQTCQTWTNDYWTTYCFICVILMLWCASPKKCWCILQPKPDFNLLLKGIDFYRKSNTVSLKSKTITVNSCLHPIA